jgi:SET domain-containing protein
MDEKRKRFSIFATAKIDCNMFVTKNGYMLGNDISSFNHSCQSNCSAVFDSKRPIIAIFSAKTIKKGDELTIGYNVNIGHGMGSPFECSCTANKFEREKRFNVTTDLASHS